MKNQLKSSEIRRMIQEELTPGQILKTPSGTEFELKEVSNSRLILLVGRKMNKIYLDLGCIEEIVKKFNSRPENYEMRIGAVHGKPSTGSLDAIVQKYTGGVSAASYLAGILEYIEVFKILRTRPQRITLNYKTNNI